MSEAEGSLVAWSPSLGAPLPSRRIQIRLTPAGHPAVIDHINELVREERAKERINQELRAWELFILRELRDHSWARADLILVDCCTHQGQPYDQLLAEERLHAQQLLLLAWLRVAQWVTTSGQSPNSIQSPK